MGLYWSKQKIYVPGISLFQLYVKGLRSLAKRIYLTGSEQKNELVLPALPGHGWHMPE